jgi:hypothetical protein
VFEVSCEEGIRVVSEMKSPVLKEQLSGTHSLQPRDKSKPRNVC